MAKAAWPSMRRRIGVDRGAADKATLAINAPNGKVTFTGGVSRDAKVTVTAKEVDLQGPMWDDQREAPDHAVQGRKAQAARPARRPHLL